ncbi:scarecrow-like protein 18 [Amborella trichopoda]|uniref:scarecrow-like protein 18 n=1 Tax=Amborella trichopoda TaxID=13333 RepID=UPI0009BFA604|nr:scarecrow-like protein 18 [Amborella trichopoda]|eukprot:XP_020525783.1 scarecrow-like protein 18 [Amborella trichopoda]
MKPEIPEVEEEGEGIGASRPHRNPQFSNYDNVQVEIPENKKAQRYPISLTALEILKSYSSLTKPLCNSTEIKEVTKLKNPTLRGRRLSTQEVIRIAGEQYLYSAEKIEHKQFDRAKSLLMVCDFESSPVGNPVQRLVLYFTDALWEILERETGVKSQNPTITQENEDEESISIGFHPAAMVFFQVVPFVKVLQFTAIQAMLDAMASSTRIHLIDLKVRTGMHWTVLMQSLAARLDHPVELLKITMVGNSRTRMEEAGNRLLGFAQTLKLPFVFNLVVVSDMGKEIREKLPMEDGEWVAVYAPIVLSSMLVKPHYLENLVKVISSLRPDIMVITEVEGKHNSPSFVKRFTEVLFYNGAYCDSLDAFFDSDDVNRLVIERVCMGTGIRSMVGREGGERKIRHVGVDVWKLFLKRLGFEEVELSQDALYQASLIVKNHRHADSCTLEMNGKALTVGWKGTPLHSVSAWRCL